MNYYPSFIAALVTLATIALILSSGFGNKIQDVPNERSLHSTPTPAALAGLCSVWILALDMAWKKSKRKMHA